MAACGRLPKLARMNTEGPVCVQKQWDGLLLNLNGIAMCQTERSVFFSDRNEKESSYEA